MKLRSSSILSTLALWPIFIGAQTGTNPQNSGAAIKRGAVVEVVAKGSGAEKAGVREGDVISGWLRGDSKGQIRSPFDLSFTEIEQAPRGPVTLEGQRGPEKWRWLVGEEAWGIDARPGFSRTLLSAHLINEKLVQKGKSAEAAHQWEAMADRLPGNDLAIVRCWLFLRAADALNSTRQWKQADEAYQRAIEANVETDPTVAEQMMRTWASRLGSRSDWEGAEKHYQEALAQSRKINDETLSGATDLLRLAAIARIRNDFAKARAYGQQSLAIKERLAPDSIAVADALHFFGKLAFFTGDLAGAEKYVQRALAIDEKRAPGSRYMASELWLLGNVSGAQLDLVKAEQYLRRAVVIQEKIEPDSFNFAVTIGDLGTVLYERGDLATAERYYQRQLSIEDKVIPNTSDIAQPLNNLGNVEEARGDLAKAEAYYRQSLEILTHFSPGTLRVADNLNNLGNVAYERGDLVGARSYYEQSLAINEKLAAGRLEMADCLNSLGDVIRDQGAADEAEKYYRRALEIREKLAPGSMVHAETLAALAGVMRREQQPEVAAQLFAQAIDSIESQTARLGGGEDLRSGFRAKHTRYYKDYIDLLVAQGRVDLAFEVLERSRARGLLETLTVAGVDIRKGVDATLLEQERSLQKSVSAKLDLRTQLLSAEHTAEQVAAIDHEIDKLLMQYNELEERIRTNSPGYAALTQPKPLSAKKVQQELLDKDTVLLEYSLAEEHSYVFVLATASLDVYPLAKKAEIDEAAGSLYNFLTARDAFARGDTRTQKQPHSAAAEAGYSEAAEKLSRMVIGPIASQIEGKRLVVVSDGGLQYVPFSVLPSLTGFDEKEPLIAKHEIVNLPSASTLAVFRSELSGRKSAPKAVAVLADPVFSAHDDRMRRPAVTGNLQGKFSRTKDEISLDRSAQEVGATRNGTFPRAAFTRFEAQAIYSTATAGEATMALDFDASKAAVMSEKLRDYRIVHLATHGLLNSEHPELSGLVFSLVDRKGRKQDGFLRLLDIYNLELNADLVVLSACQTALGKEVDGEGLVGLARGFMYAGSPRVMSSLWKVDDEATAELMKKFYEGMLKDRLTPAQALRNAQIWMRSQRRWRAPYYWAGFVLQGEWR